MVLGASDSRMSCWTEANDPITCVAKQVRDLPTHVCVTTVTAIFPLEPCSNELPHPSLPPTHAIHKQTTSSEIDPHRRGRLCVAQTLGNFNECELCYNDTSSVMGSSVPGTPVDFQGI